MVSSPPTSAHTLSHLTSRQQTVRKRQAEMSATSGHLRRERKRAPVPTYNLKALSGIVTRSRNSHRKKDMTASSRHQSSPEAHINDRLKLAVDSGMSSPLSSALSSPQPPTRGTPQLRVIAARQEHREHDLEHMTTRKTSSTSYGCFNEHADHRGHYCSAMELYNHGVWVGYLSPDRQHERYRGLQSYLELKNNCINMNLPFPPATVTSSAKTRFAMCGGCLSEQASLLTLREVKFVHNKVSYMVGFLDRWSRHPARITVHPTSGLLVPPSGACKISTTFEITYEVLQCFFIR